MFLRNHVMSDTDLITILHLSDFHFSRRKAREQDIIVEALVDDLKVLCIGHRKPDLILFTGDLVQAAGEDPHETAYDHFIDRVAKATGCSDERIFLTPGNHDLSRSFVEAHVAEHHAWRDLIGTAGEMETLNQKFADGEFDEIVADKFSDYRGLDQYLGGNDRVAACLMENAFARVDRIEALNIDLITFNTAVFSTGGSEKFESKSDERKLAVPEYAVMEAVKALTPGSLRICSTHHPVGTLSEVSGRYLEGEIAKHANIHLFGHMHDPQPRNVSGLKGSVFTDQAGAIFTARKAYYNGYSLITFDRLAGHFELLLRSYFKERPGFDWGIDVVDEGKWYPTHEARQHFRKIATPVDDTKFRAHLTGDALAELMKEDAQPGGDGDLHDRFIEPPLVKTFIHDAKGADSSVDISMPVKFGDLLSGDRNAIVYAREEYGRTTLLRELRYQSLARGNDLPFPRLPVIVDFSEIGQNVGRLLAAVRGRTIVLPDGHDIEGLLKLGFVTVMIDDVRFEDQKRMKILRDFVEAYPKARFILSSNWNTVYRMGVRVNPEMPVRFDFIELLELRRGDMRQLISMYDECDDVEAWLDKIQHEFREINLPFTAANGVILCEIIGANGKFAPVNRAVLMEQFVETTLEKASIEQSQRATFDFNNKANLLSYVAAWMAKENEYLPRQEAVREAMKHCLDGLGLDAPLDSLIREFFVARIFERRADERMGFRYRGVLEYFIAHRMTVDPEFREWILDESRYLSFVNELLYYAGKIRNDPALIDLVRDRHLAIFDESTKDIQPVNLHQFDSLPLPEDKEGATIEDAAKALADPPLTREEKDAELEADMPKDAEGRQEVFRPKVEQMEDKFFLSLVLYSGLVRNFEHMADALKREHLGHVWRSWATVLLASVRLAPRLAKERKVRINGILYEVQAPQSMSDNALLKQMLLRLPAAHIKIIANVLGTEKLRRQLIEPTLEEGEEPKIIKLFRVGLISELRLDETPGAVNDLVQTLRENPYLLWSLVVHLGELRRMDRIRIEHQKGLIQPTATAIANLSGGSRKQRDDQKRQQIAKLEKEQLFLSLKREK